MLTKRKAINCSNSPRSIRWVELINCCQYSVFHNGIIEIKLFITTDLDCNLFATLFYIEAFNDLSECSFVNNITDEVSISDLFSNFSSIVSLNVRYILETQSSVAAHCVDIFKLYQFWFLEGCKLISISIEGLWRSQSHLYWWVGTRYSCCCIRIVFIRGLRPAFVELFSLTRGQICIFTLTSVSTKRSFH